MSEVWSLRGKSVLIVDDIPDMRNMMRSLVSSLGSEDVKMAKDGAQAMAFMAKNKFDIVLCDYNLGDGKDGQQVLEEVRLRNLLPQTSLFLMITAEASPTMVMGAVEHFPDDYISKPVYKTTLQTRLRKLLEKKEKLYPVLNAMQNNHYTAALAECEKALERDDSMRTDLMRLKGDLLLELGEWQKAREWYLNWLETNRISWAELGLGKALYYLQQYDEAENVLRELIDRLPMFVAAYDILSLVLEKRGEDKEAQQVLALALECSSKSIVRQRRHGEVAYRNEDYDVAETAFKNALKVGKGSCLRSPAEFAGLARTLVKKDEPEAAAKLAESMAQEFRDNKSAQLQIALVDAVVQKSLGNEEKAKKASELAVRLFQENPTDVNSNVAMDLAEVCFQQGGNDNAKELLRHALRNQHEDAATLQRVADLFSSAGLDDESQSFIETTVQEVVEINNQGVRLAQEGKLAESISFFEKAVQGMPGNIVINMNAAQSLLLYMRENGPTRPNLQKAENYLNRVQELDITNPKYQKLKELFSHLSSKMERS